MEDLFNHLELLPEKVREIVLSFSMEDISYEECKMMKTYLNNEGYDFDYGLDGEPYDLHKIQAVTT